MSVRRWRQAAAAALAGLSVGLIPLAGCGGSGPAGNSKTVYKGPEEVDQKKADLREAMQGGAYGAAGRKAAPNMGR